MQSGTNMRVDAYRVEFIDPNDLAAEAAPVARPAFDPSTDYCAARCTNDSECPTGMGCVSNPAGGMSCGLRGLPPGRFGAACTGACTSGMCMAIGAECSCYTACAPPDDGGCTIATPRNSGGAVWLSVIVCGLLLRRRDGMMASGGSPQRLR
jgi:hypothetical protein